MKTLHRILHVEDDTDILEITKLSLETVGGYEVQQYSSGVQAVDHAETMSTDLFLLDMMMPEINGIETLKKLRCSAHLKSIPVIFMTAKNLSGLDLKSDLGALVLGVIEKPFSTMGLPGLIEDMWVNHQTSAVS